MVISAAAMCLAMNIFFEAGISPKDAQYAVALTTVNNARIHKHSVCSEVLYSKRYVWVFSKLDFNHRLKKEFYPYGKNWRNAIIEANEVLSGKVADFTCGATNFDVSWSHPYWAAKKTLVGYYGGILFYK